jgi:hypothetical protein
MITEAPTPFNGWTPTSAKPHPLRCSMTLDRRA